MASLYSFGVEVTLENYIRQQVNVNNGASTRLHTKLLQDILDNRNIKYKKTATKNELLDLIYELYGDWGTVAEVLEIGVKVNQYTDAFPFTTSFDIKRLEKFGALKVIGTEQFRAYGKYLHASLYDLVQFQSMSDDDMKALLSEHPKGKRVKNNIQ